MTSVRRNNERLRVYKLDALMHLRDPDYPCTSFESGKPSPSGPCDTDGHYMCNECRFMKCCPQCGESERNCECPVCPHCENVIDPDTCHCGDDLSAHRWIDNHSFVPMGCTCGYPKD